MGVVFLKDWGVDGYVYIAEIRLVQVFRCPDCGEEECVCCTHCDATCGECGKCTTCEDPLCECEKCPGHIPPVITAELTGELSFEWEIDWEHTSKPGALIEYIIQRKAYVDGVWEDLWTNVDTVDATENEYTVTDTTPGVYRYRVVAKTVGPKYTASVNTVPITVVPTSLAENAKDFELEQTGDLTFEWENENADGVVTWYIVQKAVLTNGLWSQWTNVEVIGADVTAYEMKDTTPGTYRYRVLAMSWKGLFTISTNSVTIVIEPPSVPSPEATSFTLYEDGATAFTWEDKSAPGVVVAYVVQKSTLQTNGAWSSWTNVTPVLDAETFRYDAAGADTGTYKYRVLAMSWKGLFTISTNALTVIINPPTVLPDYASAFDVTADEEIETKFSWVNENEEGTVIWYIVQVQKLVTGTSWSPWSNHAVLPATILEYDVAGMAAGTYRFRVLAMSWKSLFTIGTGVIPVIVE